MIIGVLSVQGGFVEHMRSIERLGHEARAVRRTEHLEGLDGLILPGGESTTMSKLLELGGMLEPLRADVARIGGSGAQREVIEDTLLVALLRGGEQARAAALLDERLHRRPSTRDRRWQAGPAF